MTLMYDTAARVQEVIDLKICNVRLGGWATAQGLSQAGTLRTVQLPYPDRGIMDIPCSFEYSEKLL